MSPKGETSEWEGWFTARSHLERLEIDLKNFLRFILVIDFHIDTYFYNFTFFIIRVSVKLMIVDCLISNL